jgi:hypothetical protein
MKAIAKGSNEYTGVEFKMTPFKAVPKRGAITLLINDQAVEGRVTSNAAWCKDASTVLTYFWFEYEGKAYYITSDHGKSLPTEFTITEGSAARKDPVRLVPPVEAAFTEGHRIEKFKATWAKNHAA